MAKSGKQVDYSLDVRPYLPWVQAFGHLILEFYEERKSVWKTWETFKKAKPEFEQLDLASFEDMLLITLFLSEWNNSAESRGPAQDGMGGNRVDPDNKIRDELDRVVQMLLDVTAERDRVITAAGQLEQDYEILASRKDSMERVIQSLEADSDKLESELAASNEKLCQVQLELEGIREEDTALKGEMAVLREREYSLARQLEDLRAELDKARWEAGKQLTGTTGEDSSRSAAMPDLTRFQSPGRARADIIWVPTKATKQVGLQLTLGGFEQMAPKKIGRWNAQRSKDGYYRLYRKIGGKVHPIYIGRIFDAEKAQKRIAEKERILLAME